jgi:hypothetical protein
MNTQSIKIPVWYWILAVLFLLWNLMGVSQFFMINFMSDEALAELPQAEQDLYNSYPAWINIVFAMAVFGGTLGAIGLLMRKKWARMAFIISLIGIVPQMIHNLFFTKAMDVYGPGSAFMPVMVVVLGFFLVWYAGFCTKKGWLR